MRNRILVTPFLAAALVACGGGGGPSPESSAPTEAPAVTAATVASIVPGATMAWTTASVRTLTFALKGPDGRPAADAGVRVFTLSRTSPQDGKPLEAPVPVSLLDSAVSDGAGHAALTLKWPAHVNEVLVVATLGDRHGQRVLALDALSDTFVVTLDR